MPTTVTYHAEYNGVAHPAINVKDHHSGMDFVIALEKLVGNAAVVLGESVNSIYPDDLRNAAYERVVSDFWQSAEQIATERGLGEITQEGRSGGWLVFTDGRDPQRTETLCPDHAPTPDNPEGLPCDWADGDGQREWLAAYQAMTEWADAWIADAPGKVARLAQSMAMDEAGEAAAVRMFATYRTAPA